MSCAVVCLPAESTIVNTSGLTQAPLVIASKKPPLVGDRRIHERDAGRERRRHRVRRIAAVDVVVDAESRRAVVVNALVMVAVAGMTVTGDCRATVLLTTVKFAISRLARSDVGRADLRRLRRRVDQAPE